MNRIIAALAIAGLLFISACEFFGPGTEEQVRQ
jgi:hypothetical protein